MAESINTQSSLSSIPLKSPAKANKVGVQSNALNSEARLLPLANMRGRGRRSAVPHTPVHTPPRRRRRTKQPWIWGKAKPWAKWSAPTHQRMSLQSKKARTRRGNIVPQYQAQPLLHKLRLPSLTVIF